MGRRRIVDPSHLQVEDFRKARTKLFETARKAKISRPGKVVEGGRGKADILVLVRFYDEIHVYNSPSEGSNQDWYAEETVRSARPWIFGPRKAALANAPTEEGNETQILNNFYSEEEDSSSRNEPEPQERRSSRVLASPQEIRRDLVPFPTGSLESPVSPPIQQTGWSLGQNLLLDNSGSELFSAMLADDWMSSQGAFSTQSMVVDGDMHGLT